MKPMTHEIMAAGPATEDASHAPKSQPNQLTNLNRVTRVALG